MIKRLAVLIRSDLRNVMREGIMIALIAAPLLIVAALRYGLPALDIWLQTRGWEIGPYQLLLVAVMLPMVSMLAGTLVGFMILDERDDGVIGPLAVTPLTRGGYLRYRLAGALVPGAAATWFFLQFTPGIPGHLVPLLLPIVSLQAPLTALVVGGLAGNKVEGLALSKALGVLSVGPVIAWFVPPPWHLIAGVLPTYWPAITLFSPGSAATFLPAGAAVHLTYLLLLYRIAAARIR